MFPYQIQEQARSDVSRTCSIPRRPPSSVGIGAQVLRLVLRQRATEAENIHPQFGWIKSLQGKPFLSTAPFCDTKIYVLLYRGISVLLYRALLATPLTVFSCTGYGQSRNIFQSVQLNHSRLLQKVRKGEKVALNPSLSYNGTEVKNRFIKYS